MSLGSALIYLGFYSAVAAGCYISQSAYPLWALILSPSIREKNSKDWEDL